MTGNSKCPVKVTLTGGTVSLDWDSGTTLYHPPTMIAAANAVIQFTNTPITTGTATVIQQAVSSATWQVWATGCNSITWNQWGDRQHETETQRTLRVQAELKAAEERKRFDARRAQAKLRARKLLVDHLNAEQRDTYEKRGFFYLHTRSGKCYRIDQGTHGNVKLIDVSGLRVLGAYCIQPSGVPDEDAMLAQALHLEMDEEEFVKRANFTRRAA